MVSATLLMTEGPYLEAVVQIDGQELRLMDEFSINARSAPTVGSIFPLGKV